MPHPKRKVSKARKNKRRTHYKASQTPLFFCKETGIVHLPHRAYTVDGNLYYRGKLIIDKTTETEPSN